MAWWCMSDYDEWICCAEIYARADCECEFFYPALPPWPELVVGAFAYDPMMLP